MIWPISNIRGISFTEKRPFYFSLYKNKPPQVSDQAFLNYVDGGGEAVPCSDSHLLFHVFYTVIWESKGNILSPLCSSALSDLGGRVFKWKKGNIEPFLSQRHCSGRRPSAAQPRLEEKDIA